MRRSTVIFLLLFIVVVSVYYLLNNREQAASADATPVPATATEVSYLFDAIEGVPVSIHIEAKTGEVVEVAREVGNNWVVNLPIEAAANQGLAEAAASQVTAMRVQDRVPNIDSEIVGLKSPEYTLKVRFTSGVERTANIGVITPSEGGYYVRNQNGEILIISRDSVDALLGMLINPPYLETPTPSPVPTETPLPATPEAVTPANETATLQP